MYVKASGNTVEIYPYSIGLLRKDNPNTSFPKSPTDELLADWGVYPVTIADNPAYDENTQQVVTASEPTLVNGVWTLTKSVESLSAEDQQAKVKAKMDTYSAAVQNLLDNTAREKGYDSLISMVSYANSTKAKWAAEATAAIEWRDSCWNEALVQMGKYVASGVEPTLEEFIAAMPEPNWPA